MRNVFMKVLYSFRKIQKKEILWKKFMTNILNNFRLQ